MNSRQLSLLENKKSMIPLPLEEGHPMVILADLLPWEELVELAEETRLAKILKNSGPDPHYRALVGALVVRSLKSCDLRSAEDLIRNYLPARYLCDLHNSQWTPDHDTIWEFEKKLGEDGVQRINSLVLEIAEEKGFLDPKSVCSDTTAQEAKTPYPNEMGLMGSFARSVEKAAQGLGKKCFKVKEKILNRVKKIKKKVRAYRLFTKSREERQKLGKNTALEIGRLQKDIMEYLKGLSNLGGYEKVAKRKLQDITEVMEKLLPQIQHWLDTGWVAKDKIISLFQPDLRAIKRGKVGKNVEFGLKWGINQIKGGYISLFTMEGAQGFDGDFALAGISHHKAQFGEVPVEFGFDRGAWSEPHLEEMEKMGVKRVAVAPKGRAKWKVSDRCRDRLIRERAQVEGKIGTIKGYGFNKPEEKTTEGMRRAARRTELRFNLTRFIKDLNSLAESEKGLAI